MSLSEIETILSDGEIVPQSRIEKILVGEDTVPQSRIEQLLKKILGGGGSVPKPLTYDYMPEGYPKKSVQTTTLMEEQEVAFSDMGGGMYGAVLTDGPGLVAGQTYTVNWDGTEYSCVASSVADSLAIGNLSFAGNGEDSGEPFLYGADNKMIGTPDTSASHIISVKTTGEVVTPMAEQFLPANTKNTTVFYI